MASKKPMKDHIHAKGTDIAVVSSGDENDYISLTDIARYKSDAPDDVIKNWMRNRDTIEFLGLWEQLNNPEFKPVEFDGFRIQAGSNTFTMSPKKWVDATSAIGIFSKAGRYGGTFAHRDIAFEFASWISAEFKLYIIKDYQRLKADENSRLALGWNLNRTLAKINYRIHTDAIKDMLIPPDITPQRQSFTFASEADVLNVALFGITAKEWRQAHPDSPGNIRDEASLHQLIVLANLESINAELIRQGVPQSERLLRLNASAIQMMKSLVGDHRIEMLEGQPDAGYGQDYDELTLMLLYLTSWQECPTEEIRHKPIRTAEKLRLTWKGHDRSALSRLDAAGLVLNDCGKAPIRISQDGEARARDLLRQYGISCADASTTQLEEH